jgi:hypothetical protein
MNDDWATRVADLVNRLSKNDLVTRAFLDANVASIAQVIRGLGPEDKDPKAGAGARVVFNMSCRHVPSFCADSAARVSRPFKNAYDLNRPSDNRVRVDEAICAATGLQRWDICFAALETSGSGVRFYGDMCLVLKATARPSGTTCRCSTAIPTT